MRLKFYFENIYSFYFCVQLEKNEKKLYFASIESSRYCASIFADSLPQTIDIVADLFRDDTQTNELPKNAI